MAKAQRAAPRIRRRPRRRDDRRPDDRPDPAAVILAAGLACADPIIRAWFERLAAGDTATVVARWIQERAATAAP